MVKMVNFVIYIYIYSCHSKPKKKKSIDSTAWLEVRCSVAQSCPTFATPWTAACQGLLSFPLSRILLKLMSIESMMPPNHLTLCGPLLLLPSIFPSIRVFSSESLCVSGGVAGALQTFVHLSLSAALESRCCLLLSPVDKWKIRNSWKLRIPLGHQGSPS